ncbi:MULTISPECIES: YcgN family cysteine cluster protein [unclassified Thalassospira]|uniref:YcgN family cysteine cluster protein n=1 Tax=unclassified Thalassospira TaxID=2648997 RepID=UPI000ED27D9F|nr:MULTISPECIES: YcgN family cysteine cluster protein [unclassified Thalassospira]HAI28886.1 YcgN family cysteine cluster protein [Thalassospira sp.]|tara:strand:- start:15 stop:479 length:465 start_codon:yes stop_codon:yes gene_type:complete
MDSKDRAQLPPEPFWETKTLADMTQDEWESLCDGCGKCCLHKLQDEEDDFVYYTSVACRLLDCHTCRCKDYPNRTQHVPDCVQLSKENVETLSWMPSTCAYRLMAEGKPLPDWHPLKTGAPDSAIMAGMSVRGMAIPEDEAHPDLTRYIVKWPA